MAEYYTPRILENIHTTYLGGNKKLRDAIDETGSINLGGVTKTKHLAMPDAFIPNAKYVDNSLLNDARKGLEAATTEVVKAKGQVVDGLKELYANAKNQLHAVHHNVTGIALDAQMHASRDIETAYGRVAQKMPPLTGVIDGKDLSKLKPIAAVALIVSASQAAANTEGSAFDKATAFGKVAVDAIPGVTAASKLFDGNIDAAALDAGAYTPAGLLTIFAREPEVQVVIDAVPDDVKQLVLMQQDVTTSQIDRQLVDAKLQFLEAREKNNLGDGFAASSQLTVLAEEKLELQVQWKADAELLKKATADAHTNWEIFSKNNPHMAAHVATHVMALKENSAVEMQHIDARLVEIVREGTPYKLEISTPENDIKQSVEAELG
jgi:hypothetical protein